MSPKSCPSCYEPIDAPIRPIVKLFQELGFVTRYSCAGYSYKGHRRRRGDFNSFLFPHIMFDGKLSATKKLAGFLMPSAWEIKVFPYHFCLEYSKRRGRKRSWIILEQYLKEFHRRQIEKDEPQNYQIIQSGDKIEFQKIMET